MPDLPFTPDDAKNLISDPTSSLCGNFTRTLLQLPLRFWQLVTALVDDDGNFTKKTLATGDKIESFTSLAESTHRKLCNGQELSQTTYAALYAAIGDTFATMDGQAAPASGNFRVPKCGGRFALAVGTLPTSSTAIALGAVGGDELVTLTQAQTPVADHNHLDGTPLPFDDDDYCWFGKQTDGATKNAFQSIGVASHKSKTSTSVDARVADDDIEAHKNVPPYYGIYVYIITGI